MPIYADFARKRNPTVPETYETYEHLLVRMVVLRRRLEGTKKELRDVRRELAKRRRTWKPKAVRP